MSGSSEYRVLEREYLEARSRILQLAALLDRLERSPEKHLQDPRWLKLIAGLDCLNAEFSESQRRAEQVQLVFSRPYDPDWRKAFEI